MEDLKPSRDQLSISIPTHFRHLKTGGPEPLLSAILGPTIPNFSRPRREPESSSPDPSPLIPYSPRLSYYIQETLDHAPEPVPKNLANDVTKAMTTNNRLEIILDDLHELHSNFRKKLDTYMQGSSSSSSSSLTSSSDSKSSSSSSSSNKSNSSSLKRMLSRRKKSAQPKHQPDPDPSALSDLDARLCQIKHWGTQVQMAREVVKQHMAEASHQTKVAARHAAKGAFIATGTEADKDKKQGRHDDAGQAYDRDIQ